MGVFSDIDAAEVAARWQAHPVRATPRLVGCPPHELARTPAAARIGELAHDAGLFCFHFEHRVHLPLPEHHVPVGRPELTEPPVWADGVLPEPKYQSFRHDLPLGSFHPQHRGKWTAHELAHGLVGFGWSPRATPFFHATAGRLAEVLPVALWYWFDEAFLRRCPLHQGGGALFRLFCRDCERVQAPTSDDPRAVDRIAAGLAYMDAELAAVRETRERGVVVPHRHATLDLSSDGVAYAQSHGERLGSAEFADFVERFVVDGGGLSGSLDALVDRVVEVTRALLLDEPLRPLAPSPAHAQARWILQDVAWRLVCVHCQTGGDAAAGLQGALDGLAQAVSATTDADRDPRDVHAALVAAAETYRALHGEYDLPDPADVFALGYAVGGLSHRGEGAIRQLAEGLGDVCGGSLGLTGPGPITTLVVNDQDSPIRLPLVDRWARVLADGDGDAAALARFEAALSVVPKRAQAELDGPSTGAWRLAAGARIERFDRDVLALAEGRPGTPTELVLAIVRGAEGEPVMVGLDARTADDLEGLPGPLELHPDELGGLQRLGLIVPAGYLESA